MIRELMLLIALASSPSMAIAADPIATDSDRAVSPEDRQEIDALLDRLYRSFNYAAGKEPDWVMMRSCFVDGALFVPEAEDGKVRAQDVDALIARWQASMRKKPGANPAYAEVVDSVRLERIATLVRADVTFTGSEPGDPRRRKPGLDSLQLVRQDGAWRVLSFVVHYESTL